MTRRLRPPAALAAVVLIGLITAGCSSTPSGTGTGSTAGSTAGTNGARAKAVKFSECMRDNGVAAFPDPDASGGLTADGVANDSSVDTRSAAFEQAMDACKTLQPDGFTGHERDAQQQRIALAFARCVRENGVRDFPDPAPDAPLIDTDHIPSSAGAGGMARLDAAIKTCGDISSPLTGNR